MSKQRLRSDNPCSEAFEKAKFAPKPPAAKGVWIECETCKRPFYVFPSRLRQAERKGAVIRYCSRKCRPYSKEFNPFWRRHHSEEAIAKMMEHPSHPVFVSGPTNPNAAQYGPQFRGKTREWWKRYLTETVGKCERCGYMEYPGILEIHHVDRNKRRNRRDNILLLCPTCHDVDHYLAEDGPYRREPLSRTSGRATLTESQVNEIRTRTNRPGVTKSMLATEFGVTRKTIANILNGNTWKSVP